MPPPPTAAEPRSQTILLVEDDEFLATTVGRDAARAGLPRAARHPTAKTALRILEATPTSSCCSPTSACRAALNGRQLADEAKRRRPDLKVLFTTGYTRNAIIHHGRLDPGVELIGKPFTYAALAARIQRILG